MVKMSMSHMSKFCSSEATILQHTVTVVVALRSSVVMTVVVVFVVVAAAAAALDAAVPLQPRLRRPRP